MNHSMSSVRHISECYVFFTFQFYNSTSIMNVQCQTCSVVSKSSMNGSLSCNVFSDINGGCKIYFPCHQSVWLILCKMEQFITTLTINCSNPNITKWCITPFGQFSGHTKESHSTVPSNIL